MPVEPQLIICTTSDRLLTKERFGTLIRSNVCCHAGKLLTQELIETISTQIVESVEYILNNGDQNL
jgi:hypothetical protein